MIAFLPGGGFALPGLRKQQYQTVMQFSVGPRKRSAAGQSRRLHIVSGLGRPSGRLFYVASRHEPPKQLINLANT
ncbi:conserved hypothetical protein [Klebsiella variicola]|nr:conserved hypothetical protein [Klebsiella variicola]